MWIVTSMKGHFNIFYILLLFFFSSLFLLTEKQIYENKPIWGEIRNIIHDKSGYDTSDSNLRHPHEHQGSRSNSTGRHVTSSSTSA